MAVPDDKERLIITLPKALVSKIDVLCSQGNKSKSEQVELMLNYFIENESSYVPSLNYDIYSKAVCEDGITINQIPPSLREGETDTEIIANFVLNHL